MINCKVQVVKQKAVDHPAGLLYNLLRKNGRVEVVCCVHCGKKWEVNEGLESIKVYDKGESWCS